MESYECMLKGDRLRDDLCKPFRSVCDDRVQFLEDFVRWLQLWSDRCFGGKACCWSKPTMRALIHTSKTMCNIIRYTLTSLEFEYFLPGKVQTDNLERP